MAIVPGYIGVAEVDGNIIRCSDININVEQDYVFYDHVIGLNDTVPSDSSTKGENVGVIQTQKRIGRPSVAKIGGSLSFPLQEETESLFSYIKTGEYIDKIVVHYDCENITRTFYDCRLDNYSFNVTAGDIAHIQTSFYALGEEDTNEGSPGYETAHKLITWDKISVSSSIFGSGDVFSFEFSANNNVTSIYTANNESEYSPFLPSDLRLGMQEVTGNIVVYNKEGKEFISASDDLSTIDLNAYVFSTTIYCMTKPLSLPAAVGIIKTTIPFVGVDKAFGS